MVEFDHFRMQAGLPNFVLSVSEWLEKTNAIGLIVKKGRYGGTYAHKDIAFEFGSAISVPFKLYLIEEFQRLKEEEQKAFGWSVANPRRRSDKPSEPTPSLGIILIEKSLSILHMSKKCSNFAA